MGDTFSGIKGDVSYPSARRQVQTRPVYKALHKPQMLCGVDRRLFFMSLIVWALAFKTLNSFLAGCLLAVIVYLTAFFTRSDPQLLPILLRAGSLRARYDPAKHDVFEVRCD